MCEYVTHHTPTRRGMFRCDMAANICPVTRCETITPAKPCTRPCCNPAAPKAQTTTQKERQ